eukprot:jgi/Mesvir1/29649/Mv21492-RA.3
MELCRGCDTAIAASVNWKCLAAGIPARPSASIQPGQKTWLKGDGYGKVIRSSKWVQTPPTRQRLMVAARAAPPQVKEKKVQIPRGDTAGAAMILEEVSVSTGDADLLINASMRVNSGDRVGLVGSNGCGKSTLLRAILGQKRCDGRIAISPQVHVGYLEQTAVSGSTRTVYEEVTSQMVRVNEAKRAMAEAEAAIERGDPKGPAALAQAQETLMAVGGYTVEQSVSRVLTGLGFTQEDWNTPCSEFSGGWQMRIALARLLLGQAGEGENSLILLDEPTNHLDSVARAWLQSYLRNVEGTLVIVSHDTDLLQTVCNCMAEIRNKKLHLYVGNYDKFVKERELRQTQAVQAYKDQQAEIKKLQDYINRFGAKASKAASAQSRKKQLDKLLENVLENPEEKGMEEHQPGDARAMALKLPHPPACHREVLKCRNLAIGYGGSSPVLVKDVDLVIERGQRMLVLGPNGCGKSTLMKTLAGTLAPVDGELELGEGAKIGFFTQDLAQDLPKDKVAVDHVLEVVRKEDPGVTLQQARGALGALGLRGPSQLRRIGDLSGGEKARIALAAFVLCPCNVLLLDEALWWSSPTTAASVRPSPPHTCCACCPTARSYSAPSAPTS